MSKSQKPVKKLGSKSSKHQKKKKAKVAEQEKEKPKKRKAKQIILSEEEEDEEADSEWIPEKHAGEVGNSCLTNIFSMWKAFRYQLRIEKSPRERKKPVLQSLHPQRKP